MEHSKRATRSANPDDKFATTKSIKIFFCRLKNFFFLRLGDICELALLMTFDLEQKFKYCRRPVILLLISYGLLKQNFKKKNKNKESSSKSVLKIFLSTIY